MSSKPAGAGPDDHYIFSIMDSSRVSTFFISILLIVYGSFRSLAMEEEEKNNVDEDDEDDKKPGVQTLDSWQALCLPLGASISLLIMFFFFESMQMVFALCTAVIATVAMAFLLLPMAQYFLRPCGRNNKISMGFCGKIYTSGIDQFYNFNNDCFRVGHDRSLVINGCYGNWSLCGLYSLC